MAEGLVLKIALILVLGVGAQWAAWRYQIPAIVLLAVVGLIAGPATGVLQPAQDFGPLLQPAIGVAVAVILFEGGMSLNLGSLRGSAKAVRRLIVFGAPLGWFFGAVAAHFIGGLSPAVAILFGGLLVVTGPTVIAPMLRQARLSHRPAAVLRWEGIVNDPVGALFAVLTYEVAVHWVLDQPLIVVAGGLAVGIAVALALGVAVGLGCIQAFQRGWVPEFLKAPLVLGAILLCFAVSNLVYDEAGLLAVTALGMTIGNSRVSSLDELRRFKEYVTTALVSSVFVVLTATLSWDAFGSLNWRHLAFIAAILLLVRPAAVLLSTLGTPLPWKERALVAWIAPRGIVAVAVAGLFATKLQVVGFEDAALLVPLAFAIVFTTVVAHGFSIGWLAKVLGLVSTRRPGILIVGASRWTVALARALKDLDVPAIIADGDWHRLRLARQQNVPTYFGDVLSEVTEHHLEFNAFGHLIAATPNDAYNALVCTDLAPELGRINVYQTGCHEASDHPRRRSFTLGGKTLLRSGADTDDLERRMLAGWTFQKTRLTGAFTFDDFLANRNTDAEILLVLKHDGRIVFATHKERPKAAEGDVVLSFVPPESRRKTGDAAAASLANADASVKAKVP
ncbi:cation:proton antiporter [Caenispirillum salinarum]|uniref:cation:proton antiporter n=1 Tax=Caenispirillum salinarum TaxID=859058 RepID=UPI00384DC972